MTGARVQPCASAGALTPSMPPDPRRDAASARTGRGAARQGAAPAPTTTRPLPQRRPADRPRDHEALDLRGALEDRVDLRVAVHALDGVLARVAVAAEQLDRALRRPDRDLAGLELAHRALGVGERAAGAAHP